MSDKLTRETYLQYAKKIVSVLSGEAFYTQYKNRVNNGASNFKLSKKRLIQDIALDWIDMIDGCLPNLDTIVRNPRKFIVQEEDIVDISLAKSISTESVKHLAQHTNMISKVDDDGTVTPNRILNITKEESFEIYENRFIYTLLLKLKDFVTMRYDKIKKATATLDVLELDVESRFNLPSKKIIYRTEYLAQLNFDEVMQMDPETLTKIERIAKIDRIITDFLSSSFAKSMRNSAPVRPPITRTNVILKEPNFKKALTLWQFVETYQQSAGFSTSDEIEDYPLQNEDGERLRDMVALNTMLFESMYDQHETDFDMADAEFADLLRVGDMNFRPDEIERDQYAQKLDEKELNPEEEKTEDVKPPDENKEADEPEQEIKPPEPEEKEIEKEVDKDVDKDVEIEAPPHDEPEDTEPDADEFDQHLFEVRKLYKRPQDDKLRQDEIIKIKDAIDRCLTYYRRIKQEEIEELEKEDRLRRQREELEKRAEAFRKQRDAMEAEFKKSGIDASVMGVDPFVRQAAKIILPPKDTDFKKAHKDLFKKPEVPKTNEKLELEDKSTGEIIKNITALETELNEKRKFREEAERRLSEERAKLEEEENALTEESAPEVIIPSATSEDGSAAESDVEKEMPISVEDYFAGADGKEKTAQDFPIKDTESYVNKASEESVQSMPSDVDGDDAQKETEENKKSYNEEKNKKTYDTEENTDAENIISDADDFSSMWGLSATTLNQKYSKASGKKHNIEPIDENKVAVGGIRLSVDERINPYGEYAVVIPKTEKTQEDVNVEEKPRKTRQKRVENKQSESSLLNVAVNDGGANLPVKPDNSQFEVEKTVKDEVLTAKTVKDEVLTSPKASNKTPDELGISKETASKPNGKTDRADGTVEDKTSTAAELSKENADANQMPENALEPVPVAETENVVQKKPKIRLSKPVEDPWALSATTLNQKYSKPGGKTKNIEPVDENKVAVGDIRIIKNEKIDPYAELNKLAKPSKIKNKKQPNAIKPSNTTDGESAPGDND